MSILERFKKERRSNQFNTNEKDDIANLMGGTWTVSIDNHNCKTPPIELIHNDLQTTTRWKCNECGSEWILHAGYRGINQWNRDRPSSQKWKQARADEIMLEMKDKYLMSVLANETNRTD